MKHIANAAASRNQTYKPNLPKAAEGILSPGGRVIFDRIHRCASTCNRLAELAGLGPTES